MKIQILMMQSYIILQNQKKIDSSIIENEIYKLLQSFINFGKYRQLDFNTIDMNEFVKGLKVELEHTNNILIATKIV